MISEEALAKVYGAENAASAKNRFTALTAEFTKRFPHAEGEIQYFTAPGRTEIVGNHVDHNGGKILAASIEMDTVAAAAPNGTSMIHIVSEGYDKPIDVDLDAIDSIPKGKGSTALVAGLCEAARKFGYTVGGFDAYIATNVIGSAGLSSSASFEMLLCAVINHFFNGDAIDYAHYARMGQYSENHFWNKASGLMDQMACAVGGTILLDFAGGDVKYEKVDFSFDSIDCDEIIINTGKGHAALDAEYSSIPDEMHAVARLCGKTNLCEVDEDTFVENLPALREKIGNDRAVLRALHYFEEVKRVEEAEKALAEGRPEAMLDILNRSGQSSWEWLQNIYVPTAPQEQPIALALALAKLYLAKKNGKSAVRVHGGGFAGVIMCVVPKEETKDFTAFMARYFGEDAIYVTGIRQTGAAVIA